MPGLEASAVMRLRAMGRSCQGFLDTKDLMPYAKHAPELNDMHYMIVARSPPNLSEFVFYPEVTSVQALARWSILSGDDLAREFQSHWPQLSFKADNEEAVVAALKFFDDEPRLHNWPANAAKAANMKHMCAHATEWAAGVAYAMLEVGCWHPEFIL